MGTSSKTTYKINFSLRPSRNFKVFGWGTYVGGVVGFVLSELYSAPILALIGGAVSPAAVFCLPLVMVTLGAIATSFLFWCLLGDSNRNQDTRHTYHGVSMVLNAIESGASSNEKPSSLVSQKDVPKPSNLPMFFGKLSAEDAAIFKMQLKLSIARFSRGAIPMAILGAAGALTAGWFFATPVMAMLGLSGAAAAAATLAYPVVLLLVGALLGVLIGGAIGVGIGKLRAWHKGSDQANPTFRNAFTQVRLMAVYSKNTGDKNWGRSLHHSYRFIPQRSSKLELAVDGDNSGTGRITPSDF